MTSASQQAESGAPPSGAIQAALVAISLSYMVVLLGSASAAAWYTPGPKVFRLFTAVVALVIAETLIFGSIRLGFWALEIEHDIQHTFTKHARVSTAVLVVIGVAALVFYTLPEHPTAAKEPKAITARLEPERPATASPVRPWWLVALKDGRERKAARLLGKQRRHAR